MTEQQEAEIVASLKVIAAALEAHTPILQSIATALEKDTAAAPQLAAGPLITAQGKK